MSIGVEIRDASVIAAAVDEQGRVTARAAVEIQRDVVAAATAALKRVLPKANGSTPLAIATPDSDSKVIQSLTSKYPQAVRIGCGTAAAVGESWIGAAKGVADVVYFGAEVHAMAGVIRGGRAAVGAHGREPVIGWLALNPVEREDYRKSGWLGAEVAAAGIV